MLIANRRQASLAALGLLGSAVACGGMDPRSASIIKAWI